MLSNVLLMAFQVAAQQGAYLADCFNRMEECEKNPEGPLRFRAEGRHRFRPFRYELNFHDILSPALPNMLSRSRSALSLMKGWGASGDAEEA